MKTAHKGEMLSGHRLDRFADEIVASEKVSERVLDAFRKVDRAAFAPADAWKLAYTDKIIRLKEHSTISQPSLVALMLEHLDLRGQEKVLEIGTATGYQAALLSQLATEVYTIEVDEELAERARQNLAEAGCHDVTVVTGDGAQGVEKVAPFDRIIITAGLRAVPKPLLEQLAIGGKIVVPLGEDPEECRLVVVSKISETEIEHTEHGGCQFVPFFSTEEGAWTPESLDQVREERIEKRREPIRTWLVENWEAHGHKYEEIMPYLQSVYADLVGTPDRVLSEGQVIDIMALTFDITRPIQKTEPVASTDSAEKISDGGQIAIW